jgi:hypothetical protein
VETRLRERRERPVHRSGANAIQPAAAILTPRRGERRAADLLGVQAVRDLLRRIAADRKRASDGFGGELVGESCLVTGRFHVVP